MAREKLSGIYIPVITPFNKDESINFSAIKELSKFLADNGVTGIIPSGSTGEITALTVEEQIAVNKAYIEAGHEYEFIADCKTFSLSYVTKTRAYISDKNQKIDYSKFAPRKGKVFTKIITPQKSVKVSDLIDIK